MQIKDVFFYIFKLSREIAISGKICLKIGLFFLLWLDKVLAEKVVVIESRDLPKQINSFEKYLSEQGFLSF